MNRDFQTRTAGAGPTYIMISLDLKTAAFPQVYWFISALVRKFPLEIIFQIRKSSASDRFLLTSYSECPSLSFEINDFGEFPGASEL